MSKEGWICSAEPVKPVSRPLGLATQPLKLAARPADDIEIDPLQGRTQLRLVEVAVVVEPTANARVVHLGQVLQGLVAAMMKRPAPNCSADGRQRLRTGGGQETRKGLTSPSQRFPRPEHKPEPFSWLTWYKIPKRYTRSAMTPENPDGDPDPARPWEIELPEGAGRPLDIAGQSDKLMDLFSIGFAVRCLEECLVFCRPTWRSTSARQTPSST